MFDFLSTQADTGYMLPWSFLFATALIASALDAFAKRLFHPVVLTTWFFGLSVCAALGSWSIPELTAGAICLMTPHFLICSFAARASGAQPVEDPETKQESEPRDSAPKPFVLETPKPVEKDKRRAA